MFTTKTDAARRIAIAVPVQKNIPRDSNIRLVLTHLAGLSMELLFVILRLLFGPECFSTERLEPVMVRADGRNVSARLLAVEYLRSRLGLSWPNLQHVCQERFADDSPSCDTLAALLQRWIGSSKDTTARSERRKQRS
jgi:hypothetical protein